MSFQSELIKIREHYSSELSLIFEFVKTTEERLTEEQNIYNAENITENERTELITFIK